MTCISFSSVQTQELYKYQYLDHLKYGAAPCPVFLWIFPVEVADCIAYAGNTCECIRVFTEDPGHIGNLVLADYAHQHGLSLVGISALCLDDRSAVMQFIQNPLCNKLSY